MSWKETVTTMSDRVFPGLSQKIEAKYLGNEVTSNLPLQMSLYFNAIFIPFWSLIILLFITEKYHCYSELYKFVAVTTIVAIFTVEVLRLYLGYEGNLRDKIPELAGFWMLSVLLQLPLQGCLLLNPYFELHVLELVVQSTMFTFLFVQVLSGYFALKYTAKKQALYFRIMKLRSNHIFSEVEKKTN